MFYTFTQNNSGGVMKRPAVIVIVEADNMTEANDIAADNGIYFDGVRAGRDCSCCGDRWYAVWEEDSSDIPTVYGQPVDTYAKNIKRRRKHSVPEIRAIFKDGTAKNYA